MAHLSINFISAKLGRAIDIDLIVPSLTTPELGKYNDGTFRYQGQSPFPLLYLLHGSFNDHHSLLAYTSIERYAEERNIAVCTFSAENKYYLNSKDEKFEDFLEEELPDYLLGNFPLSNRREDTYIAGLSMGGFGALYHALKYPNKYMMVGAFSPAIIADNRKRNPINLNDILEKDVQNDIDLPFIYLAIGDKDFLLKENKVFMKKMKTLKVNNYQKIVPGYEHEWSFWDLEIKNFLDALPRSDAYKDMREKI
jgi:Predicted esterase